MSVRHWKPVCLPLFLPGRTPFQQEKSGVMDLAGGWMAGGARVYSSAVGVCLCEFYSHAKCVFECVNVCLWDVNSGNAFVCLPLCDCVNQGI